MRINIKHLFSTDLSKKGGKVALFLVRRLALTLDFELINSMKCLFAVVFFYFCT